MPYGSPYYQDSYWEAVEYQGNSDFVRPYDNTNGGWVWDSPDSNWYRVMRYTNWGYDSHVKDRPNWHIRAAEIGDGDKNWIVDVKKTGDRLNWWRMDDNWVYSYDIATNVESGTTYWNNIERWFNTDFDNNGLIAHQNRETEGSIDLLYDNTKGRWVNDNANQRTFKIMRGGSQSKDAYYRDLYWKLSAGETINGTNYVVDVGDSRHLYVWEMDDNWNYIRDSQYAQKGSSLWNDIERSFKTDFDNNGLIAHQNRETEGSVDLLYDDTNGAWINDNANQKTFKIMRGSQVTDGYHRDLYWKLSAGETINGTNYVVDVGITRSFMFGKWMIIGIMFQIISTRKIVVTPGTLLKPNSMSILIKTALLAQMDLLLLL